MKSTPKQSDANIDVAMLESDSDVEEGVDVLSCARILPFTLDARYRLFSQFMCVILIFVNITLL